MSKTVINMNRKRMIAEIIQILNECGAAALIYVTDTNTETQYGVRTLISEHGTKVALMGAIKLAEADLIDAIRKDYK